MSAASGRWRRLGYTEAAAGLDLDAGGDAVPAPQLAERDAEAVGDGDQRIAAADGVEPGADDALGRRRDGHGEGLEAGDAVSRVEMVGRGQVRDRNPVCLRHRGQSVSRDDGVVAPGIALGFGDRRDALRQRAWPCRPADGDRRRTRAG